MTETPEKPDAAKVRAAAQKFAEAVTDGRYWAGDIFDPCIRIGTSPCWRRKATCACRRAIEAGVRAILET